MRTHTLPSLNGANPFIVVRVDGTRMGIIDGDTLGVWIEEDLVPTRVPNMHALPRVATPVFPQGYGAWQDKSIGGVSRTVRRVGTLRAVRKAQGLVTLFATHAPSADAVGDALRGSDVATVGDPAWDATYGHVAEVVVHDGADLEHAAAVVARAGATPILEKSNVNARRAIGIERLDRIEARVTVDDDEDHSLYGPRRGNDNWRFPWLPEGWHVPITWDHMVANVANVRDITVLPQPLRQHVARARLAYVVDAAERRALARHVPSKRLVSAGLSRAQSKQLIHFLHATHCTSYVALATPLPVHRTKHEPPTCIL